jgi:PAS domain S-box-containing protein/putative nucleotidyltransferase with HDIG domain
MEINDKTKEQLVNELVELRGHVKELESAAVTRKNLEKMLEEAATYAENIIDTVREPLLVLDSSLKIISANRSFYGLFKVTPEDTIGNLIYSLGNRQWDIPGLRKFLEDIIPKDTKFDGYQVDHIFQSIGRKIMLLNARQVHMEENSKKFLLLAIEDITERSLLEIELKESEGRFRRLFETAKDGLLLLNKQTGEIVDVNKSITDMLGYSSEELIGKMVRDVGLLKDTKDFNETILELIQTGLINYENVLTETRDGQILHTDIYLVDRARLIQCNVRDITERKLSEEKQKRETEHLAALRQIDAAILGSQDLRFTLNVFLDQTIKQLNVDAACVLLFNPHDHMLEYASGHGFSKKRITLARVRIGQGYAGRVAMERKTLAIPVINNVHDDTLPWHLIEEEGFKAYIGVPLIAKGRVKGVLEIFNRTPFDPDMEWLEFTEALAGQAAIALDSAELFEQLERSHSEMLTAYDTTIEGWSRALDYRDKETEGHSIRVTEIAVRACKAMGMSAEELVHVRRGALLHDIGKLGVPDSILLKPGKLTDDEFAVIKRHPDIAFKLLSPIAFLRPAMDIPYCHHEKLDGSGYPRGLKGEEIPLAARIFAIVDVWDALCSDRPYRLAWPEEKAREYLRSQAGIQFDANIVGIFLSMKI